MARISKSTGTYCRSNDFPDIGDYTYTELRKACEFYYNTKRETGECNAIDMQSHFRCSPHKARLLLGAAEFHEKMKKKGLAK